MESRSTSAPIDAIAADLNVINRYFPDNLEQALKELNFPDSPKTVDEVIDYMNVLMTDACQRLLMSSNEFFPYSSKEEIKAKICPPLKEIFEKNSDKLVVVQRDPKERGELGIHPLLSVFYKELEYGDFAEGNVKAKYGSKSVGFENIEWDTSEIFSYGTGELYFSVHPDDFYDLTGRVVHEGEKVRMDYDIVIGHNPDSLTINMLRTYSRRKPTAEIQPIIEIQARQETEVKLIAKPRPPIPKEDAKAILLMLDKVTCDVIKTELKLLYATLTRDRGDLVDGDIILDAYIAIKDLSPDKTFKEPDTLVYRNKITSALNEIIAKEEHTASKKTE